MILGFNLFLGTYGLRDLVGCLDSCVQYIVDTVNLW